MDDPDLLLWVHNCAVDSLLSTARRAGLPLSDEDADAYVLEQVAAAGWWGCRRTSPRARWPTWTPTSSAIRPELALTPAASDGVRRLFVPPMKGWVQVLTPARPAWGTLRVAGVRHAAGLGAADVLDAGLSLTDAAATAALRAFRTALLAVPQRARWSPIVRAGYARVAERPAA